MFKIPEDKVPDALKDEDRLNVLFSPLRARSANSKDWDDKISTWKHLIKLYCESNNVCHFSVSSLREIFSRHGRPPSCFKEVIEDMIKSKEVELFEVFIKRSGETWKGWISSTFITGPFKWIMKSTYENSDEVSYVHLDIIRSKCNSLVASFPMNYENKVIHLNEFLKLSNLELHDKDSVKLLLHHMSNQQKIGIANAVKNASNEKEVTLIKVCIDGKNCNISETDIGLFVLEQNYERLSQEVLTMEDEIQDQLKSAKMHLSQNHRQMAKMCLVKKHNVEKRLARKSNILHNIHVLLEQIKDTYTDGQVFEAYKTALDAFNQTYKETGLAEDAIEDTVLKLGEALEIHEDLQRALAFSTSDDNNADLEEELEDLLKQHDINENPSTEDNLEDLEKTFKDLNLNPAKLPAQDVSKCVPASD